MHIQKLASVDLTETRLPERRETKAVRRFRTKYGLDAVYNHRERGAKFNGVGKRHPPSKRPQEGSFDFENSFSYNKRLIIATHTIVLILLCTSQNR